MKLAVLSIMLSAIYLGLLAIWFATDMLFYEGKAYGVPSFSVNGSKHKVILLLVDKDGKTTDMKECYANRGKIDYLESFGASKPVRVTIRKKYFLLPYVTEISEA